MANEEKKDFNAMLRQPRDMPRVQTVTDPGTIAKYGGSRMLLAPPLAYDAVMRTIPAGRITTTGKIRAHLAQRHQADFTDPMTAGIFVSIAAWASHQRQEDETPYWRTLKAGGELNIFGGPLDAKDTLIGVGLGERLGNFPAQLSGGEQQRVAIARALAKNPKILLCDEPTGALDYNTGKAVLQLLQDTCRKTGRTVIVITHNSALTAMADRVIRIKSGKAISNEVNQHPTPVEEIEW